MNKVKFFAPFVLLIVYDFLFWSQSMGLNAILFTCIAVPILLFTNKFSIAYLNVQLTVVCTFLLAVLVVIYNSGTAKVAYIISFAAMTGCIHQPSLRTVYYPILVSLIDLFSVHKNYREVLSKYKTSNKRIAAIFRYTSLMFIPFVIVFIFYWIFKLANPVFDELSSHFWDKILIQIELFFEGFSFVRFLFLLVGLCVCSLIVFKSFRSLGALEGSSTDDYHRVKDKGIIRSNTFGSFYRELSNELRVALITVALVNVLLLIVNAIDIHWIWFNFDYSDVENLSQFVHEGTYLLILSILISIGIILYFFRGSLNLSAMGNGLKKLTYFWIFQNTILAISVAVRNYHYIHQHGLAYKRIGVVLFLMLVVYGLITLIIKVKLAKSSFYLFRLNGWAVYFVMLFTSCFNWDIVIARHNLSHSNQTGIDYPFLLSLSDKTLFILKEHQSQFKDRGYSEQLDSKIALFERDYTNRDFQSFTFADKKSFDQLKQLK